MMPTDAVTGVLLGCGPEFSALDGLHVVEPGIVVKLSIAATTTGIIDCISNDANNNSSTTSVRLIDPGPVC